MSLQAAPDVPLLVTVPSVSKDTTSGSSNLPPQLSAERRINPSWTVAQLKAKLEPITGIPPGSQDLRIRGVDGEWVAIEGEERRIGEWSLRRGGEIEVHDTRPPTTSLSTLLNPSLSSVEKYTLPHTTYSTLTNSVLNWKRTNQLGRFNPSTPSPQELAAQRSTKDDTEIATRGIAVGRRCRVGGGGDEDGRRGVVAFVGEVRGLGGESLEGARWVGIRLDEPVGRNDGCVAVTVSEGDEGEGEVGGGERRTRTEKRRLFECEPNFGVVVRPEKMEVGEQWVPLDDLGVDEDMEEL